MISLLSSLAEFLWIRDTLLAKLNRPIRVFDNADSSLILNNSLVVVLFEVKGERERREREGKRKREGKRERGRLTEKEKCAKKNLNSERKRRRKKRRRAGGERLCLRQADRVIVEVGLLVFSPYSLLFLSLSLSLSLSLYIYIYMYVSSIFNFLSPHSLPLILSAPFISSLTILTTLGKRGREDFTTWGFSIWAMNLWANVFTIIKMCVRRERERERGRERELEYHNSTVRGLEERGKEERRRRGGERGKEKLSRQEREGA